MRHINDTAVIFSVGFYISLNRVLGKRNLIILMRFEKVFEKGVLKNKKAGIAPAFLVIA